MLRFHMQAEIGAVLQHAGHVDAVCQGVMHPYRDRQLLLSPRLEASSGADQGDRCLFGSVGMLNAREADPGQMGEKELLIQPASKVLVGIFADALNGMASAKRKLPSSRAIVMAGCTTAYSIRIPSAMRCRKNGLALKALLIRWQSVL